MADQEMEIDETPVATKSSGNPHHEQPWYQYDSKTCI